MIRGVIFDLDGVLVDAVVDILLFGNNLVYDEEIVDKVIATIKTLVERREITEERLDKSYQRIQTLKRRLTN